MNGERILVVDDELPVTEWIADELRERGLDVETTTSPEHALARIAEQELDVVIADVEMPGLRGPELMRAIHAERPAQLVVLITAFGSIDLAVSCMREGAADFLAKPFRIEALVLSLERVLRERRMWREIVRLRAALAPGELGGMVAKSPAMKRALDVARRAAQVDSTVLLTGESGAGKGAIARFIHEQSPRRGGPLVTMNCAALPASLAEAELFGVRRGAYTDAREDRPGVFVQAEGGTLLLDEIGEMALEVQPKLLSVLETGRVRVVGGSETEVSVGVIGATNRPLEEALRERRFRPDLYHRLNVIRIEVPPLRERREDIEPLVAHFLQRFGERFGRPLVGVSLPALRWLCRHPWPGNVRELANLLERAVALTEHDTLTLEDFAPRADPAVDPDLLSGAVEREWSLADLEREYIRRVLHTTGGNKARAARILGLDRRTLYRKASELEGARESKEERT